MFCFSFFFILFLLSCFLRMFSLPLSTYRKSNTSFEAHFNEFSYSWLFQSSLIFTSFELLQFLGIHSFGTGLYCALWSVFLMKDSSFLLNSIVSSFWQVPNFKTLLCYSQFLIVHNLPLGICVHLDILLVGCFWWMKILVGIVEED